VQSEVESEADFEEVPTTLVVQPRKSAKRDKLARTKAKRKHLENRSSDIIELKLEEDRLRQELDRAAKLFNNLDDDKQVVSQKSSSIEDPIPETLAPIKHEPVIVA